MQGRRAMTTDQNRITALRAKVRKLEDMVYTRDQLIQKKYNVFVSQDKMNEAVRRARITIASHDAVKLAYYLTDVLNGVADELLKELRNVSDKAVCSTCDGKGCEHCDMTGVPTPRWMGGSGVRVIRKTGGLT